MSEISAHEIPTLASAAGVGSEVKARHAIRRAARRAAAVRAASAVLAFAALAGLPAAARADVLYVSRTDGSLTAINTATGAEGNFGPTIFSPYGLTTDGAGNLYVASNNSPINNTQIITLAPSGLRTGNPYSGTFVTLEGLALDRQGNLFAGDFTFGGILEFPRGGGVIGFGQSPPGAPRGLAFDAAGDLFVATDIGIYRITPGGVTSLFSNAGTSDTWGLAFDANGNLYAANAGNNTIERFTPGGVGSVFASTGLSNPKGLAFDSAGNLYAANYGNNTIERFTPDGVGSLFETGPGPGHPVYLALAPTAAVPEPGCLILMGGGLLVMVGVRSCSKLRARRRA